MIIKTIKKINSQLDILPTILNLMGVDYYQNYYLGSDILSPNYSELVFFQMVAGIMVRLILKMENIHLVRNYLKKRLIKLT